MSETSYKQLTQGISSNLAQLRQTQADVMKGFGDLGKAAMTGGALDAKELIALAIGVATHCEGCIGFHSKALAQMGASLEEVHEALGVAIYMGGGPSVMYAANAVAAFNEFKS